MINLRLRLAINVVIILGFHWLHRHWQLDDALIYARYFRHAIEGRGVVFNDGEYVNGLTSVLYSWLVLGVSFLLHGHILLVEGILSAAFLVVATSLAETIVPLSGIVFSLTPLLYMCKGMETSLFLALLTVTILAYKSRRADWLPLLCLLCCLARFEGGALMVVVGWRCWQEGIRPRLRAWVAPALIVLGYLTFNFHFYHRFLPQSAAAKIGQGMSGFWGKWPNAFLNVPPFVAAPIGGGFPYLALLALIAWLTRSNPSLERWNRVVLPFLAILGAFYILGNIPNYHWYYAPFMFFLTIAAVQALPSTQPVRFALLLMLLLLARDTALYLHHQDKDPQPYDEAGQWLSAHTAPNARIASVETGHIGWFCDRYLIDIVGLTTPRNGNYTSHRDFSSWFLERPDFIVVHPEVNFPWEKVALSSPDYEMLPVNFGSVRLLHRKDAPLLADPPQP